MKAVSAREANQGFSELLSRVEGGEEVMITKHGRPVAMLTPYRAPTMTPERQAAFDRLIALMDKGLNCQGEVRRFSRDEMHER